MKSLIAIDLVGPVEDAWLPKRHELLKLREDIPEKQPDRRVLKTMVGAGAYEAMRRIVYTPESILCHPVVSGAVEALTSLCAQFDVALLSARNEQLLATTMKWLEALGLAFAEDRLILLGDDHGNLVEDKLTWCERKGALYLIDDELEHLKPGIQYATRKILLNLDGREFEASGDITVATSWQALCELMLTSRFSI